ncbi:MAG: restriction endonuclease subunit S [Oscillospiraceae bacterium]|nr:restriction endonuclease subunit S [Oscillospiraceae bacterium]
MNNETRKRIESINNGTAPAGYKKTKVGIVPEEWKTKALGQVLTRVSNAVDVEPEIMYTQIGIRSHGNGLFYKEPVSGEELGNKSVFWIEPDCFILNIVFAWEQAIGKTTEQEVGMIASHRFPMYKPNDLDIDYLVFYLLTKRGTVLLDLASPGGAGRNRTLGQEHFLKSKLSLPPLPEQQKIAEILTAQDAVIALMQKQIELLQKQKKAFLQKMFPKKGCTVPEIRFAGFTDAWEQRKLGDLGSVAMCKRIFKEQTTATGEIPFYKIGTFGGEPDAFISRELFEEYKAKFSYPEVGDMLISASGTIGRTVEYTGKDEYFQDSNIVWFKHDDRIDNSFLRCLYSIVEWSGIEGSTIKRLYNDNFLKTEFMLPCVAEQRKVGSFFSHLDTLITLHQRKLENEQQKKKAIMQLLLTGKVRCV